MRIIFYQ